ncbi:DUF6894 family protein [Methylobacterium durans]|uniref:DUF6894 domain-containing protein n=1 Tax=Methylobacterium durans TaxID=2202825 RepID=A0A2U8WA35_9HYPH|nr:hypothetical protein DK389_23155 [Methylobacterium durans]
MLRYFFDVHDSGPQFDDTGTELAGPDEAYAKAKSLLPDIASELIPTGGDQRMFMVLVRDENGHAVYSATLAFAGQRLQR